MGGQQGGTGRDERSGGENAASGLSGRHLFHSPGLVGGGSDRESRRGWDRSASLCLGPAGGSMKRPSLLEELAGGDRRSIGRVPSVVRRARRKPAPASHLVRGLRHDDPLVRMRAAAAPAKGSRDRPALP